jgi:DNA-binding MarR family transcriptional regulator
MATLPLALLLLRASRWFDQQLLEGLQRAGWPTLSPAQSLVFAYLDPAGIPPAELARRLGHSRQATQQLLNGLVALDLLALRPNPARRGGLLVTLTDRGQSLTRDARRLLAGLEHDLGARRVEQLRSLLDLFDPTGGADPRGPARRSPEPVVR